MDASINLFWQLLKLLEIVLELISAIFLGSLM